MPGVFETDDNQTVWQQLPVRWRQPKHFAWLKALVTPVRWLRGQFNTNRANNLYRLDHNGQVCKLEAALNDIFDPVTRGIFISDPDFVDPDFLYRRDEEKPVFVAVRSELPVGAYTAPIYLYRRSELYMGGGPSFIVNVPATLFFDEARMRALIERDRLPGRVYEIVTF